MFKKILELTPREVKELHEVLVNYPNYDLDDLKVSKKFCNKFTAWTEEFYGLE